MSDEIRFEFRETNGHGRVLILAPYLWGGQPETYFQVMLEIEKQDDVVVSMTPQQARLLGAALTQAADVAERAQKEHDK